MTLETHELYSESTRGPLPRIQPDEGPGAVVVRTFATAAGADLLKVGCPVYIDATSGHVKRVVPAGTAHASATVVEQIHGIIWPSDVKLDATNEVLATVMFKGSIHIDELTSALNADAAGTLGTTTPTANQLLAYRNPVTRYRGIHIEGLTQAK